MHYLAAEVKRELVLFSKNKDILVVRNTAQFTP